VARWPQWRSTSLLTEWGFCTGLAAPPAFPRGTHDVSQAERPLGRCTEAGGGTTVAETVKARAKMTLS
jgi:hypothetical protein